MKLGKAFSDSLTQGVGRPHMRSVRPSWWLGVGRVLLFTTVLFFAFFILLWRLFDLTVVQGHQYRVLANENRTRELVRHAPRGILYDRTGKPLVTNTAQYRLIKPCQGIDRCVETISQPEGEKLERQGLPGGWYLEVDYVRTYVYPEALAHAVGYTGELSEKELADEYYSLRGYHAGDRVGRSGAEAVYEERLRGRDGRELVEVDAEGKIVRTLGRDPEIPGQPVTLSLDGELAKAVAEAFPPGRKGAVVVSKPETGELLALYSNPSYTSNAFSLGLTQGDYERIQNNPDRPLFDRAIGGVYPPGSTFKIVTALAALEEQAITKDTTVEDIGVIKIGPFSFPNWFFVQYGKTDGVLDIVRAIQRSNDIFFYKAGEALGITKLSNWARRVGIGKPLGIELAGEAGGLVPDPAWKAAQFTTEADRAARNDEWYLGDTYHVAIGQGYLLVSPLQVNTWTNVVASGGMLCQPTIEKVILDKGKVTSRCKAVGIKKETIDLIMQGMQRACSPGGTGWPLFNFNVQRLTFNASEQETTPSAHVVSVPVACKTGTAEFGDPQNHTHAWFTTFAPLPNPIVDSGNQAVKLDQSSVITGEPEIAVTVLVEGAGEGSDHAAPVAKKIFEEWFRR